MRCPTCGEILQPGQLRCPTCGARHTGAPVIAPPGSRRRLRLAWQRQGKGIKRCPRCNYQGEGIRYFRRPGHIGLLVGVSLFTYGIGGLIYWMARRRHLICPSCGLGWEHASRALALEGAPGALRSPRVEADEPLPSGGVKRRVAGVLLILFASHRGQSTLFAHPSQGHRDWHLP